MSSGTNYYRYLLREIVEESYWQGRGAELLNLDGHVVRKREFGELIRQIDPESGYRLKAGNGRRVNFYDACIHAPKSVSILSLIDERITSAHQVATSQLMARLEDHGAVSFRGEKRQTRNLIMAPFEHRQSRALDIQLHTHVVIMNLSYDPATKSWKALSAEPIFFNRHEFSEEYRTTLARRITQVGYDVSDKPRVGFEIHGVPRETIERYSQRASEIQRKLRRDDPKVTAENVGRWTRDHDKVVIPPDEFRELQLAKLTHSERITLRETVEKAYERSHKLRLRMDVAEGEEHTPSHRLSYGPRISM